VRFFAVAISVLLAWTAVSRANPDGLVPSLAPPGNFQNAQGSATDVFIYVDYEYEVDKSNIMREHVGAPSSVPGTFPVDPDLVYHQYKHTITPRIEVGLLHDTWIYGALPIVISQARELSLASGVDRTTSSTVADGLLPMAGFDANSPSSPPSGDILFRGRDRWGLDQVHVGIGVAPMNQARDDTKPTWKIGAEARIAIGKVMRFDPTAPTDNTAVGRGVHEIKLWTTFDRRMGWAEPWVEMFWQVPIATSSASLFQNVAYGATNTGLQQQAGVRFGFEAYAIDDNDNRVSLDLGARAVAHFEGRDYSEMWEVFSYAGSTSGTPCMNLQPNMPPGCSPLILNADAGTRPPGTEPESHPGISNIENYLETAARVGIRAELGTHVRFAVLGDIIWKTDHVISFADAGVDKNGNNLVDPGTDEVNPLHVDRIDLVGHRYHSVNNLGIAIGVNALVLF
jgi:hypothetical protein